MKRTNLLLAVVLAFAVSSCQQEDTSNQVEAIQLDLQLLKIFR